MRWRSLGQAQLLQQVEQFDDARLEREAGRGDRPEMLQPDGDEVVDRKSGSEMFEQHLAIARPREPDRAVKNLDAGIVSNLHRSGDRGFEIQPLTVEQEAVHVEDDSLRHARQVHPAR